MFFFKSCPLDFCSGPGAHRGGSRHKGNAQDAGECKLHFAAIYQTAEGEILYFSERKSENHTGTYR